MAKGLAFVFTKVSQLPSVSSRVSRGLVGAVGFSSFKAATHFSGLLRLQPTEGDSETDRDRDELDRSPEPKHH